MTPKEMVKEEAEKLGRVISDETADYILWEYTGFPEFFILRDGESRDDAMRREIREALQRELKPFEAG